MSIYLLGFPLTELKGRSALRIRRQYEDAVTGEILNVRDDFIEKLTHDCYVLQLSEIQQRRRSKLERLMSIFEQLNLAANQHLKDYADHIPEEFAQVIERLGHAALDEKLLKEVELEKEIMNSWLDQEKALELKIEAACLREREERRQKEEAQHALADTYFRLLQTGMSPQQALALVNLKEEPKKR